MRTFTQVHNYTYYAHLPMLSGEKYSRDVRVIPVDFSSGMEIYPRLAEELKDLDVGVLSKNTLILFFRLQFVYHI